MNARSSDEKVICRSVSDYISAVQNFRDLETNSQWKKEKKSDQRLFFFRGHAKSTWQCLPGIARGHFREKAIYHAKQAKTSNEAEWVLFSRFRDSTVALEPPGIASV